MNEKIIIPEFVYWGHPKKTVPIIADFLLDYYLAFDCNSKTSFDLLPVTENAVVVSGKVMSTACIPVFPVVRHVLKQIGYSESIVDSFVVEENIQGIAREINRGMERHDPLSIGAGSSEMVCGYASNETGNYMPPACDYTQQLTKLQLIANMHIDVMNIFCGCDPSKIQRAATYAARHIAKNLVAAGVSDEVIIQVAYVEGIAEPVSFSVNTCNKSKIAFSDSEIAHKVYSIFDMRPKAIEHRLKLRNPIYLETALQGHFGQNPQVVEKTFETFDGETKIKKNIEVELFTWEKLDYVDVLKKVFELK